MQSLQQGFGQVFLMVWGPIFLAQFGLIVYRKASQ